MNGYHIQRVLKVITCCLLFSPLVGLAVANTEHKHSSQLRFEHIFDAFQDSDLPHSHLPLIAQEHNGMMWFAGDGLYRYDGTQLHPYQLDPMSTCSSFITGITVDQDGILWLATEKGVCTYDAQLDRFMPFRLPSGQSVNRTAGTINVSPTNDIYIGFSSEIAVINAARTTLRFYSSQLKPQYPNHSNEFKCIFFESADSVWIGSLASGLVHYSPTTNQFIHYMNTPATPDLLPSNDVRAIATDDNGALWFGMYEGGVSKLLADRTTFKHYLNSNDTYNLGSSYIWSITLDSTGQLWLASNGGGLLGYNAESDSFFAYKHNPNNNNSIANNRPSTIFEDNAKNLWVSVFPDGIDLIDRGSAEVLQFYADASKPHTLNDDGILSIFKDSRDNIWIGSEKGLNRFDPNRYSFDNYSDPNQNWRIPPVPITDIAEDHEGRLWLSTWGSGLYRVDPRSNNVVHFKPKRNDDTTVDSARLWKILPESNHLLLATEGIPGLLQYRFDTQRFNRSTVHDVDTTFNEAHVYTLLRDAARNLWIGSIGGLYLQSPAGDLKRLSAESADETAISSFRIRSLFEDQDERVWIGTEDQGVFIYTPNTKRFQHIALEQGLPSNNVTQIQQSRDGDIWLFTRKGLARIEYGTGHVKNFTKAHGLADSNFNRGAGYIDSNGTLYAGSARGLSILNVQHLKSKAQHFPVHITGLKLFNKTVNVGQRPLQSHAILHTKKLTLSHTDDVFTLSFAGLSYPLARWNQYAYKLEGYDSAWNYIGKNNSATYTNIPPGEYVFRVKAQDQHGNWSDQQGRLDIIIDPAPWQTGWAYTGYFVLAILLLRAAFYLHIQRLKYRKEKLLNAEIIRLNTVRERLRRDFMTDISHELRTPLSILTGEIEAVQDGIRPLSMLTIESIQTEVSIIKKIVNDLYDLALSDSGTMQCKMETLDIANELRLAAAQMHIKFEQKSISLNIDLPTKGLWIEGDKQRLHQLFLNLLENSFRYTNIGGTLVICAHKSDGNVKLIFSDTAPGVDPESLKHIFKRFYTVDPSRNREHGGSGLGLSICQNIAFAHGAKISAHPSALGGLEISLEFPLSGEPSV